MGATYAGKQVVSQGYASGAAVAPNDTTDLTTGATRALFVGGAGNIAVIMEDGSAVTFNGVTAGTLLPISVSRVKATNTTATNILALY